MTRPLQSRALQVTLILATLAFLAFPVALGLANTLIVLFMLAWLVSGSFAERWAVIRSNPVPLLILALYGLVLIGISYSSAPWPDVGRSVGKYAKLLLVPLLFSVLVDPVWQRRCLHAFAAAMLFILASTWLNVWFVLPWSATQTPGWGLTHHVIGDYITQNVMMSFFVLLCLVDATEQKNPWRRGASVVIALLAAVSITHLSYGRTGVVLLMAALALFALSVLRGRTAIIGAAAATIALATATATSPAMTERFEQAIAEARQSETDNTSSIGHRLYNYRTSIELISDRPFFGWGTGAYHTKVCDIVEKPEWCEIYSWHPHNQYLLFGVNHGFAGMLLYVAIIAALVVVALRDMNRSSRTLLLGFTALLAVDSLFNSPMWSSRESHFFILMMALLLAKSSALRTSGTDR